MSNQNQRPDLFQPDPRRPGERSESSSSAARPRRCRSTAARPGSRSAARTPITTPSGSTPRTRASSWWATTAASTSATTAASTGIITTTSRSASSIRFRPTCGVPTCVCGGLQDNNAWCGPSALRSTTGPVNTDWFTVAGGDGFYTRQDPTDWAIVYARIAGRQHDPSRSAQRHAEEHPADRGRDGRRRRPRARRQRACSARLPRTRGAAVTPADAAAAAPAAAGGGRRRTRRDLPTSSTRRPISSRSASTGTRRSRFRRTTRRCVYMAAQYFFKSTNRGDTWWMNTTGSHQERQPLVAGNADHERRRRQADGRKARWLCRQFADHAGARISLEARHHLGRHRRRQPAGQPRTTARRSPT